VVVSYKDVADVAFVRYVAARQHLRIFTVMLRLRLLLLLLLLLLMWRRGVGDTPFVDADELYVGYLPLTLNTLDVCASRRRLFSNAHRQNHKQCTILQCIAILFKFSLDTLLHAGFSSAERKSLCFGFSLSHSMYLF